MAELTLLDTPDGRAQLRGRTLSLSTPRGQASVALNEAAAATLAQAAPGNDGPREVERKFLVTSPPDPLSQHPSVHLRQGYIVLDAGETLRIRDKEGGGSKLTVKRGRGLSRLEAEIPLEPKQAAALWPLAGDRVLSKTRYEIPDGDGVLELDLYEGALEGLATVEREFESETEAQAWRGPAWVGPELTDDARYTNARLARDQAVPEFSST